MFEKSRWNVEQIKRATLRQIIENWVNYMGLLDKIFNKPQSKKLTKQQWEQIARRNKIMADSLKIIQETDNLDTFFSRYKLADDTLNEIALIAGYDFPCIAGETPEDCIESLRNQKESQVNNCLDRYIRKETVHILGLSRGRKAKAKGVAAIIEEYAPFMTEQNLEHGRWLAEKMMKKIDEIEGE